MIEIKIDEIIYSHRKTLGLEIKSDGRLFIRAPKGTSIKEIKGIVHKKREWIGKKQKLLREKYKSREIEPIEIKIDEIIYSNRKSFCLDIKPDGRLIIRAPIGASQERIRNIINKKSVWIRKKLRLIKERDNKQKEFLHNRNFLYLGKSYPLLISDKKDYSNYPLILENNNFILAKNYTDDVIEVFAWWYKKEAYRIISERIVKYSSIMEAKYNKIGITNAMKRWGSCGSNGNLNFSWRLIMTPLIIIDYVVIHELAHLEELNHSKRFWNKVASIMPDYKRHRDWLKKNGHLLNF